MNVKLSALARKMNLQTQEEPAPAPTDDLAGAIQQLVDQRIELAMAQHEQMPVRAQRMLDRFNKPSMPTDYRELPPVPRAAAAKPFSAIFHRDGAGLILWAEMGSLKVEVLRDGAGKAVGMREITESPVLPELAIPFKAESRKYKDGV